MGDETIGTGATTTTRPEKLEIAELGTHLKQCGIVLTTLLPLWIVGFALHGTTRYVTLLVVFLATLYLGHRSFRLRLIATPDGVSVDNFWRTYRIDWDHVDSVGRASAGFRSVVGFRLTERGVIRGAQATAFDDGIQQTVLERLLLIAPPSVRLVSNLDDVTPLRAAGAVDHVAGQSFQSKSSSSSVPSDRSSE
jgi:hypothetical protein